MLTETLGKLGQQFGGIKQYFSGLQYPVNKQNLIEFARSKGASPMILSLLERLPDKQYRSEQEVSDEIEQVTPSAMQ